MDHAAAEGLDTPQRVGHIAYGEVGQGKGIARAGSASVDTHRGGSQVRLPAISLSILTNVQLDAEELRPEAPGTLGVVCGELDE